MVYCGSAKSSEGPMWLLNCGFFEMGFVEAGGSHVGVLRVFLMREIFGASR